MFYYLSQFYKTSLLFNLNVDIFKGFYLNFNIVFAQVAEFFHFREARDQQRRLLPVQE